MLSISMILLYMTEGEPNQLLCLLLCLGTGAVFNPGHDHRHQEMLRSLHLHLNDIIVVKPWKVSYPESSPDLSLACP